MDLGLILADCANGMSLFVVIYGLQIIVKLCQFKDYIGLIAPAVILLPLPKDGNGNSRG